MDAYLIIAQDRANEKVEAMGVYLGKNAGARKAMEALRAKHPQFDVWSVEPIEIVDTFGGVR